MSTSTPTMYPLPIYSAKDTAITQRPTSTALLAIDSEDRFTGYEESRVATTPTTRNFSPYDFTINKSQSLMNGFFTRLGVSEIVFPWLIPNINPGTSRMIVAYTIGGGPVATGLVQLDYGFYTPSLLASAIQTQVRALNPALLPFTMTYGVSTLITAAPTQRTIFEYQTNDVNVEIAFSPLANTAYFSATGRRQLFDLLGFNTDNINLSNGGYSMDTLCQFTRYVDIVCTQLTANQALKDTMSQTVARDVLVRLYLGDAQGVQSTVLPSSSTFCPPGCMPTTIYRDYPTPKQIQWMPNQPVPGYLRFEVYDDAGANLSESLAGDPLNPTVPVAPLEGYQNNSWSMSILVSEN